MEISVSAVRHTAATTSLLLNTRKNIYKHKKYLQVDTGWRMTRRSGEHPALVAADHRVSAAGHEELHQLSPVIGTETVLHYITTLQPVDIMHARKDCE